MANSPLDFFRRHKVLVMGTMLLSMVLFILGGSLNGLFSGRGAGGSMLPNLGGSGYGSGNNVVFSWSGGDVTELEMAQMREAHRMVATFLQQIVQATQAKGAQPPVQTLFPLGTDEGTVVDTLLMAAKAKKLGVEVNEKTVKDYLADLSAFSLSDDELTEIADRATNKRVGLQQLLDQLRHELLAQYMRVMLQSEYVTGAISVAEAWDYHNRLNRRVSIEAYPIQVAAYEEKVSGSPTESQKREMFDKYKLNPPNPEAPTPGFYRPAKMAFDYLKVDFAPFLEKAKEQITDDQVKAEYDLRVSRGEYKVPVEKEKPAEEGTEGEAKPEDGKPAEEKPADDKPAEEKPAAEDKPAEEAKPATTEEKPAESTGPKECFQEEPAAEEPAAETPKAEEPKAEAPAADAPKADAPAAETPKPPEAQAPVVDDKPATEEPKPDAPADKPAEEAKPEMRIQTLDEVKDAVRTSLAQPIANDAMRKELEGALQEISVYGEKYYSNKQLKEAGLPVKEELKPLDVQAIAKKFGFEAGSTPLVNRYEVVNYEIGKDGIFYRNPNAANIRNFRDFMVPFPDFAFSTRLAEYEPQQVASSKDPSDLNYVFWVTEVKAAEQPQYTDKEVQDAIVAAWKKEQALELAKKAAEEMIAKAKEAKSLKDVVPETEQEKIVTPPPFSWFTFGSLPFGGQSPEMSTVAGIEGAAHDFMRPVTKAGIGDAVVGIDFSHKTVYLVKVLGQEPSEETLLTTFYEGGLSRPIRTIAGAAAQDEYFRKMEEIQEEFSLKWNRAPNAGPGDGENS